MKTWQKMLIPTLITLVIGGIYLLFVWHHRQDPGVIAQKDAGETVNKDDLAVVRTLSPAHFEDTLRLEGKPVWMKNGYVMPFYSYTGGRVAFAQRKGLIPSMQRLDVKKIVKQAAPAGEDDGMGHGSRQAFAVFALPGSAELYATPIGVTAEDGEAYYCDVLFYYDDPHTIYNDWPKDVWAAIEAHQVKPGMSELQTHLAIGRKMHADRRVEGDRTVTFDENGKHWTVTFVNDRATVIKN
jgi:hypothetical protein